MTSESGGNHGLDALRAEAGRLGVALDPAATERFARYLALLAAWNERAGLTSVTDPEEIQRRHFAESLALLVALRGAGHAVAGQRIADLGPGGGFPSVPIAIVEPEAHFVLIESHGRRAEFLNRVVASLDLAHVEVVHARVEDAARDPALRETFDLVLARALAPLRVLVEYAVPLLRRGGVLASPKGSRAADELSEAFSALAALGAEALPGVRLPLAPGAEPQTVVLVRRVGDLDARYPRRAGIPAKRPL